MMDSHTHLHSVKQSETNSNRFAPDDEDLPPKKPEKSQAEIHLKELLKKQLDTNTDLQREFGKQKKEFIASSFLVDNEENRAGIKTLLEFQKAKEDESELIKLRDYGLTDEEILLKLKNEGGQIPKLPKRPRYGESTASEGRKMQIIESKIETHERLLDQEDTFSCAKEVSRLEMEIEGSLHKGTEKAHRLRHLVKQRECTYPANDPVLLTLKEYEERSTRKAQAASDIQLNEDNEEDDNEAFVGPELAPIHIRVKPLDERIVQMRKLDIDQLKAIPKFQQYERGTPSKVLFVKNLAKCACVDDLAALFVRFENLNSPSMDYKVMKGRMRGQAFITFSDIETATEALVFANGYQLHGKPMVISYGRNKANT